MSSLALNEGDVDFLTAVMEQVDHKTLDFDKLTETMNKKTSGTASRKNMLDRWYRLQKKILAGPTTPKVAKDPKSPKTPKAPLTPKSKGITKPRAKNTTPKKPRATKAVKKAESEEEDTKGEEVVDDEMDNTGGSQGSGWNTVNKKEDSDEE